MRTAIQVGRTESTVTLRPAIAQVVRDTGGYVSSDTVHVPLFRWPELAEEINGYLDPEITRVFERLDALKQQDYPEFENQNITLYRHQRQAVGYLYTLLEMFNYGAIHDDPGLGKTAVAITLAEWGKILWGMQNTLVLCPPYLVRQWARELSAFASSPFLAIPGDLDSKRKAKYIEQPFHYVTKIDGGRLTWEEGKPFFTVVGYDSLRNAKLFGSFLQNWDFMVLDEVTTVYNTDSVRGQKVRALLTLAKKRLLMTGTPVMNGPLDVYGWQDLLCGMPPEREWFLRRYVVQRMQKVESKKWQNDDGTNRKFSIPVIVGFVQKRAPELGAAVGRVSIRRRRKDAIDLPEMQYRYVKLNLTTNQRKVYDALVEAEGPVEIGGQNVLCDNRLAKLTALRIAADGLQHWGLDGSAKLDSALAMVSEGRETPTLILCSWKALAHGMVSALNKCGIPTSLCIGGQGGTRDEELLSYAGYVLPPGQERSAPATNKVMVATIDAIQFGLNLQLTEHVIMAGMQYNPKKMEQALLRAHRLGGTSTLVSVLITEDTVEDDIFTNIIQPKTDLITAMSLAGDIETMMEQRPDDFIPKRKRRKRAQD